MSTGGVASFVAPAAVLDEGLENATGADGPPAAAADLLKVKGEVFAAALPLPVLLNENVGFPVEPAAPAAFPGAIEVPGLDVADGGFPLPNENLPAELVADAEDD